jgi:PAS domain S-box-containing protein
VTALKLILAFGSALLGVSGVCYGISSSILLNSFAKAEQQATQQDVERVLEALSNELHILKTGAMEYSRWDDTYAFIQDRNQRYVSSNFTKQTFASLRLNLVVLIHSSGQIVFQKGCDLEDGREIPVPESLQPSLKLDVPLLRHPNLEPHVNLVLLPEGPLLLASSPILTSTGKGPSRGSMLMGRYLNSAEIERLAEQTRTSLTVHQFNHPQLPNDFQAARSALLKAGVAAQSIVVQPLNRESVAGYAVLQDIDGNPALLLRVEVPRTIYEQGLLSLKYFRILALIMGFLIVAVIGLLLQQFAQLMTERDRQRYEAKRREAEAALYQSEEKFRQLAETIHEVFWISDPQKQQLIYISPAYEEIWGRKREDLYRDFTEWTRSIYPQDWQAVAQTFLSGETKFQNSDEVEYRIMQPDGSTRWIKDRGFPVRNESGEICRYVGIAQDITDYKQLQLALQVSEAKLNDILNSAIAAITSFRVIPDHPWQCDYRSAACAAIFGYTAEELMADLTLWRSRVLPEDLEMVVCPNLANIFAERTNTIEYRFRHQDGTLRWISSAMTSRRDEAAGCWTITTVEMDITERKQGEAERQQAEAALQQLNQELEQKVQERTADLEYLNQQLQLALSSADMGIWEWDITTNRQYWSPENYSLLGFHTDPQGRVLDTDGIEISPHPTNELFLNCVHPADRARLMQMQRQALEQRSMYEIEHRLVWWDGTIHWRYTRGAYLYNQQGQAVKLAGVSMDITHLKRTEEALRQSEEWLLIALESANMGAWDLNLLTGEEVWSVQSETLFGFTAKTDIDITEVFWDQLHPDDWKLISQAYQQALQTGCYLAEYRIILPEQTIRWIASKGKVFYDETGKPVRMSGVDLDITERKQAEEQLRVSLQEKEVLLKEIHHRVKNNLQMISSLLDLQAGSIHEPKILEPFIESQRRIKVMALIHERLYRSENLARINLADYIHKLVTDLFMSYAATSNINLQVEIANIELEVDTAITCGLIVNELASNAIKHAFPGNRSGEIEISFSLTTSNQGNFNHLINNLNHYILVVRDNGIGVPEEVDFHHIDSLGLQLVCALTKKLQGTIELDRSQGSLFKITFMNPV